MCDPVILDFMFISVFGAIGRKDNLLRTSFLCPPSNSYWNASENYLQLPPRWAPSHVQFSIYIRAVANWVCMRATSRTPPVTHQLSSAATAAPAIVDWSSLVHIKPVCEHMLPSGGRASDSRSPIPSLRCFARTTSKRVATGCLGSVLIAVIVIAALLAACSSLSSRLLVCVEFLFEHASFRLLLFYSFTSLTSSMCDASCFYGALFGLLY